MATNVERKIYEFGLDRLEFQTNFNFLKAVSARVALRSNAT